jgi:protocatechuate 3,4-dioxygenase beta subunit
MSEEPAEERPPSRRRLVVLGAAALVVIAVAVVLIVVFAKKHVPAHPLAVRNDGGAAIHAPIGPKMPVTGVQLTGIVVDGAGLPVAGATIEGEPEKGMQDRALATADAGVSTHDAGVAVPSSPTGNDGRFAIGGLDAGRYRLRVTGTGLLAAEVRMVPVPSDELRIVVARQVEIAGIVTDDGKAIANANVGILSDAIGGTLDVKTDSAGKFSVPNLPEGRYQVYAYKGPLATTRTTRVTRLGAGPFTPVELRLEAGENVSGRVIDRDEGTGLIAAIELRPVGGEDQAPRYARSNDDGSFIIEGVPNGQWIADAFAPGYLSPGGVELTAGQAIVELAMERGATIEGRVLDGEGHPVDSATVRVVTSGKNPTEISALVEQGQLRRFSGRTAAPALAATSNFSGDPQFIPRGELGVTVGPIPPIPPPGVVAATPASVIDPTAAGASLVGEPPPLKVDPDRASIWTTGADGRYRIRGLSKSKLNVLAVAAGYAEARSKDISIGNGQVLTNVDIILTAGTFVFGKVSDKTGAPIAGAQVTATPELGLPLDAFSDGDGMYRLGPISGKIDLVASAYGHVEAHHIVDLTPPKGRTAAEQREDIVLEVADAILAGTLDDAAGAPIAGANIEIISGAASGRHAVVAADGTFNIDMLPSGPLRIRIDHPSYPSDELEAVASTTGQRARLRLALGGQVEGVLLDAASGNVLAGMTIDARGPGGRSADTTSDDKGFFKLGPLKPGKWKIEIKQPGYLALTKDVDVPVSRAPGEASLRDVRLELQRGAILHGTVRDRRGQRVAGAMVTIERTDGVGEPVQIETNAQGEFDLHDAPTGELSIVAKLGDAGGSVRTTVRPGGEVLTLAIEIR